MYRGNSPFRPWNAGNAISNGSKAMVISPLRPALAIPAVVASVMAPRTPTDIRPHKGNRTSDRTIGTAKSGRTVSSVRPGNHHPIMVIATKVAISICAIISPSASLWGHPAMASNAKPGTVTSNSGAHRPMPNRRSMSSPQSR